MKNEMTREMVALRTLAAGGFFRYALEMNRHFGSEKFVMRLYSARRAAVKGIGHATKRDLEDLLVRRPCAASSTWPEEWEMEPTLAALYRM